jgi:hypothetical protein
MSATIKGINIKKDEIPAFVADSPKIIHNVSIIALNEKTIIKYMINAFLSLFIRLTSYYIIILR